MACPYSCFPCQLISVTPVSMCPQADAGLGIIPTQLPTLRSAHSTLGANLSLKTCSPEL